MQLRRYPLTRLSEKQDLILFLIKEELKSRKLFHVFHEIELDDCWYQPHLDSLIMDKVGLDHTDESFVAYDTIMDKRSRKIHADQKSVMKQAMKAYMEIISLKKERVGSKGE